MPINFRNEGGASLHPGGDRFIAGGSDLWVRVFDFETGTQMECLKVHLSCHFVDPPGHLELTEPSAQYKNLYGSRRYGDLISAAVPSSTTRILL